MSEIDDLIRRLEEASGPDRELADEVLFACGWQLNFTPAEIDEIKGHDRPDPTKSLDAAVTLVPDGKWWFIGPGKSRPSELLCSAIVIDPDDRENIIGEGKSDAGPALALCIAALRARKEIA